MTDNELLQDKSIEHQVDLIQYANGVVRKEIGAVNDDDEAMLAALLAMLIALPPGADVATVDQRLFPVLRLNADAYQASEARLRGDLRDMTEYEAQFQENLLRTVADNPDEVEGVNVQFTFADLVAAPFMGVLLGEAMGGLAAARALAIRGAVRAGVLAGQTADEIMRAIRGTRAAGYSDGILSAARSHLETTIRTVLAHAASFTREAVFARNKRLVPRVMWISVLDGRTSQACRARSNKLYRADTHAPIGHAFPWGGGPGALHFNCRSSSTPLLPGAAPDRAPSYNEWLARQPAAVQDRVLGPNRGKMYRQGSFDLDEFTNDKGRLLTLAQLREKDAEALAKAGVPLRYWSP
jgi:hypothetical protein